MASSADKLCFDSYDLLARDADVLALAQAQWFSAKDIDPWDPATAREKCAQAVRCNLGPAAQPLFAAVCEPLTQLLMAHTSVQRLRQ
jgi:hypothetical protein